MPEAIEKIERYTAGLPSDQFEANEMVLDAVVRNLEIIGEGCPPYLTRLARAAQSNRMVTRGWLSEHSHSRLVRCGCWGCVDDCHAAFVRAEGRAQRDASRPRSAIYETGFELITRRSVLLIRPRLPAGTARDGMSWYGYAPGPKSAAHGSIGGSSRPHGRVW